MRKKKETCPSPSPFSPRLGVFQGAWVPSSGGPGGEARRRGLAARSLVLTPAMSAPLSDDVPFTSPLPPPPISRETRYSVRAPSLRCPHLPAALRPSPSSRCAHRRAPAGCHSGRPASGLRLVFGLGVHQARAGRLLHHLGQGHARVASACARPPRFMSRTPQKKAGAFFVPVQVRGRPGCPWAPPFGGPGPPAGRY